MFSKDDLKQALDMTVATETQPIMVRSFGPEDFEISDSEQYVVIFRSPSSTWTNSLQYWLACLQLLGEEGYIENDALHSYALAGHHRSLSESDWRSFLCYCTASLRNDLVIDFEGRFLDATLMTDEWNDRSALCETDSEYLAVFWGTTA
jgi:hypothetical protein